MTCRSMRCASLTQPHRHTGKLATKNAANGSLLPTRSCAHSASRYTPNSARRRSNRSGVGVRNDLGGRTGSAASAGSTEACADVAGAAGSAACHAFHSTLN
jgi:hypothetical protein